MKKLSSKVLDKLRTFDTPTICNLIALFDVRPRNTGSMDARIRANFPELPPMIGYASTATCRSVTPPCDANVRPDIAQHIDRLGELFGQAVIVFQDLDGAPAAATFGEIMCATYKNFGAAGLISNGAGRDLAGMESLKFPVFTSGTVCAYGYCHIVDIHIPVHVGGIEVRPNDLLHGDLNGVTTIPNEIAAELADIGDEYVSAERSLLAALRSESLSTKNWREARAQAKARIARIRAEVCRKKNHSDSDPLV